jgi:hypothetical protein
MSGSNDAGRLETLVNSTVHHVTRLVLAKELTTTLADPTLLHSIIMIGFYLSFARKETVYNRHIRYFPSCPVSLLKMSIEAANVCLLLFNYDYLPGCWIL